MRLIRAENESIVRTLISLIHSPYYTHSQLISLIHSPYYIASLIPNSYQSHSVVIIRQSHSQSLPDSFPTLISLVIVSLIHQSHSQSLPDSLRALIGLIHQPRISLALYVFCFLLTIYCMFPFFLRKHYTSNDGHLISRSFLPLAFIVVSQP